MTKYPPGTRVKVAGGSGIDSDKSGAVVAWSDPRAKETLEGNRRLRDKGWIAVLFDDGSVSCQPESRLSAGGPKVEARRGRMDYDRVARQTASRLAGGEEAWRGKSGPLPEANMRIINRPLAADLGGRRWLTIQCCGTFQCRDDEKRATCASCKRSRTVKELLFELHDREESERAKRFAAADYDRVARQVASGESEGGPLDLGPDAPFDRPVRREPREKGKGRGRWLALDTMDHIVGCVQRAQQRMSAGGVQDGAYLVRVALEELQSLHAGLKGGELTDDAWDV